ncbi:ABC transporter permease [Aeromicrobium wangtongii]|uniref:ABC transporter permease subunit n=1 Tax=Aeromicrobium wangtongii TaxID=2969247 RepID=A0ABY5MAB5_9ACTN|nr:ABC transporter permease subunit [Aeromicrobium wangtongii]MCD9196848.1 ABC transporter permease subunit [Aeromicrobium wangtongii]UUP14357.1 ABC transporter permease subunit [Aeromicrobium wangtongii]
MTGERARTVWIGAGGALGSIALWWIAAATVLSAFQIPTPLEVVEVFHERGFGYYERVFSITLAESARGYVVGVVLALATAMLVLLVPILEPLVMQFAVITYCLPIVVLAPILITVHEIPEKGGLSPTAIDLAAVSVFFTTVVGAVLGFRAADRSTLDVVEVYGGSRFQQFRRVRLVSALPPLFSTLQIAAPAAFLGALLGEYFDRHLEIGVGPSLILSQNNRETALAWSLGIGCAVVSGLAYVVLGLVGRAIAPWSKGVAP